MIANIKNILKIQDLRNKILFTLGIVALYRVGAAIRVPGVDPLAIEQLREGAQDGALGLFNLFSGGAFESFSIFALGIMPYITASIIMQVLGVVIPKLEELQQQGAVGQRKITQYTRYVTITLSLLQATVTIRPGPMFTRQCATPAGTRTVSAASACSLKTRRSWVSGSSSSRSATPSITLNHSSACTWRWSPRRSPTPSVKTTYTSPNVTPGGSCDAPRVTCKRPRGSVRSRPFRTSTASSRLTLVPSTR